MKPFVHLGMTMSMLAIGKLCLPEKINWQTVFVCIVAGVFLDADKMFEIIANKKKKIRNELPDISGRWRILHNIFAFPFGAALSYLSGCWFPFLAVLLHIVADSAIPTIMKNGKTYPSHPPLKWFILPIFC